MGPRAWVSIVTVVVVLAACVVDPRDGGSTPGPTADRVTARQTPDGRAVPSAPLPSRAPVTRDAFDAQRAAVFARALATEVGARPAGSSQEAAARDALTAELRGAGWTVTVEPFPLPQGGTSANVVAWKDRPPAADPHVVVGAHVDTVAGSPGANDNASGLGVIVALAEELADERTGLPVVLVGFGAEEYQPSRPRRHHLGSEAYAAQHADRVVAALIIDMAGDGDVTCICWFPAGPDTLAHRLDALAPDRGFEVRSPGDISDHGPFARRGRPAAFLWTGFNERYHTSHDTSGHLDTEDIRRAGNLVLAFLRDLRPSEVGGLAPS